MAVSEVFLLQIAGSDLVQNGVASDKGSCISLLHTAGQFTDDYCQVNLIVYPSESGGYRTGMVVSNNGPFKIATFGNI